MLSFLAFSPNYRLSSFALIPSSSSSCFVNSHASSSSSFFFNSVSKSKLKISQRASSEGVPNELIEDSKFVPLNADDPTYGPPIQQLLKEIDGEFLKVIFCTKGMVTRSLWEAMHTTQSNLREDEIDKSLPRICFLSGLSGEEMMMFIDAFPETGLEPAVFAALVPNSAKKPIQELIEEIMGDHEMLTGEKM
ncbi:hypothetical protein QN277_011376 [Acacia crassicarpa]|uniref:Uncharacterized protein n=1 Tax=Acacia crassicarpa TaxID=499986 RepID=A0AAE1MZ07_9FABA|nr:hypothetical protein QN277_011376 [Acacia crassicarpa]